MLQTLHAWCRDSYQCKLEDNPCFLKSQVQQGRCIVTSPRRSCITWYEIQHIQTHLWEKRSNHNTWRDWAHHLTLSWGVAGLCLMPTVCWPDAPDTRAEPGLHPSYQVTDTQLRAHLTKLSAALTGCRQEPNSFLYTNCFGPCSIRKNIENHHTTQKARCYKILLWHKIEAIKGTTCQHNHLACHFSSKCFSFVHSSLFYTVLHLQKAVA